MISHPPFGPDTVTFETVTVSGSPGALGTRSETPTDVVVPGCRHRPLSAEETPQDLVDVSTQIWRTTAPPAAAVLAATPTGRLRVNGLTYEIVGGPKAFTDPQGGGVFKVTIHSKRQVG